MSFSEQKVSLLPKIVNLPPKSTPFLYLLLPLLKTLIGKEYPISESPEKIILIWFQVALKVISNLGDHVPIIILYTRFLSIIWQK